MKFQNYEPTVKEWRIKEEKHFLGRVNLDTAFKVGLTPPDPSDLLHSYFTVFPIMTLRHEINGDIFKFEVEVPYRIENNQIKPTPELLFDIVKHATVIADVILKHKGQNTLIHTKRFPEPDYYHLYPDLIQAILLVYR